jgi:hypothetical protein
MRVASVFTVRFKDVISAQRKILVNPAIKQQDFCLPLKLAIKQYTVNAKKAGTNLLITAYYAPQLSLVA